MELVTRTLTTQRVLAPVSGPVLPLEQVPDPVFAKKVVGPGLAIDPTSGTLLAPIEGTIVQLHRALHAVTVQHDEGWSVLLHIGLDTVKLEGEGFKPFVRVGDRVRAGQPLIAFDSDLIARHARSLITLMIFPEMNEERLTFAPVNVARGSEDAVVEVMPPTTGAAANGADTGEAWHASAPISIQLPTGLHARPAALLVGLARSFVSEIKIVKGSTKANAKSVVGIMTLEIASGDRVFFEARGTDSQEALYKLDHFLRTHKEAAEPVMVKSTTARRPSAANSLGGVGVSPGVAIGRVHQVRAARFEFAEMSTRSAEQENEILELALKRAAEDLERLAAQVKAETDASRAAIFAAHQELLQDPDLKFEATKRVALGKSAAFAWNETVEEQAVRLATLNNELMANRANDLRDVGRRVLRLLCGEPTMGEAPVLPAEAILIAENLTPSETVQLDRSKVLGFCTTTGGATSHVAILARSLGLPAIAGIDPRALDLTPGAEVILDGDQGELKLEPSAGDMAQARATQTEQNERRTRALSLAHTRAVTRDQHAVEVAANIGSVADAREAVRMGADGVGLLRSEFLFLERDTAPSEQEQFQVYQEIADVLGERTLVIRTLDVGGDKPLKYLPIETEENPFLGVRGIRVGFLHPEILREQLRAILRVTHKGKLAVMFPMVASIEDFRRAKTMLEEERAQLGRPPVEVGIMVEVPSVALTAEVFARECDFFSVGTNDLTQYTLAMDRGHTGLAKQVDALHPSVLTMIALSVQAAHRHGKWVGVCGGLASDLKAVPILLGLGVDELSVSIPTIPLVKSAVREQALADAKDYAQRALGAESPTAVRALKPSSTQGPRHDERVFVPAEDR